MSSNANSEYCRHLEQQLQNERSNLQAHIERHRSSPVTNHPWLARSELNHIRKMEEEDHQLQLDMIDVRAEIEELKAKEEMKERLLFKYR
ncbi:hypothetical protein MMC09_003348 [Bachmanniomyces sp. S44760]|nr:hypothetical protein [Bachmanniomyces sp. S44760]